MRSLYFVLKKVEIVLKIMQKIKKTHFQDSCLICPEVLVNLSRSPSGVNPFLPRLLGHREMKVLWQQNSHAN
uniref:Uncharacterized protein n=2 Tax=Anguilla anguilla TaxID=7936 RepID=A0A0E9RN89_ANGAN